MHDTPTAVLPCQPDVLARLPLPAPHVAAWVRLVDRAEVAMYVDEVTSAAAAAEPGEYTQRAASSLWDAVYQAGHTLTPSERIHARAYLWLRDNETPLPTRDERAQLGWALCPCTHCRYQRLTGVQRRHLGECAPEAQRQYAQVAAVRLSPAYRATHETQAPHAVWSA
jgi:hypothetical protein